MAKFVFIGCEEYIAELEKLGGKNSQGILKYAVYPGAAAVADAIRSEIESKHSDTGELASSLTLSTMRNDSGFVNTKVGFSGYDSRGVPNALKAAVLESGNSKGRKGTHCISKAVKGAEAKAIQAMSDALDEKMSEIVGG